LERLGVYASRERNADYAIRFERLRSPGVTWRAMGYGISRSSLASLLTAGLPEVTSYPKTLKSGAGQEERLPHVIQVLPVHAGIGGRTCSVPASPHSQHRTVIGKRRSP